MTDTPAQVPQPDVEKALPVAPDLYSSLQIGVGAFLGSFLAAGWLARQNLVALGKKQRANRVLASAIALQLLVLGIALVLPPQVPGIALSLPVIITARMAAEREFGAIAPGFRRSWGGVIGIALLSVLAIGAVLVAAVFVLPASVIGGE